MFGLPSAPSFPFVKQDRAACRRYMRTVHWQIGEQVSRTVQLVSRGPPGCGCWHAAVSARASLFPKLHLRTIKIGKRYSLDQSPKVAAHPVQWRRVLSLARSIGEYREAGSVFEHVRKKPCMRTYTTNERLARSRSPITRQRYSDGVM